jgi:hypothetical protein
MQPRTAKKSSVYVSPAALLRSRRRAAEGRFDATPNPAGGRVTQREEHIKNEIEKSQEKQLFLSGQGLRPLPLGAFVKLGHPDRTVSRDRVMTIWVRDRTDAVSTQIFVITRRAA